MSLTAILEALVAFFKAIPVLDRLFTKPTEQKVADQAKDRDKEFSDFDKMEPPK